MAVDLSETATSDIFTDKETGDQYVLTQNGIIPTGTVGPTTPDEPAKVQNTNNKK